MGFGMCTVRDDELSCCGWAGYLTNAGMWTLLCRHCLLSLMDSHFTAMSSGCKAQQYKVTLLPGNLHD